MTDKETSREVSYNFGGLGCAAMMIAFGIMWALIATGPAIVSAYLGQPACERVSP